MLLSIFHHIKLITDIEGFAQALFTASQQQGEDYDCGVAISHALISVSHLSSSDAGMSPHQSHPEKNKTKKATNHHLTILKWWLKTPCVT